MTFPVMILFAQSGSGKSALIKELINGGFKARPLDTDWFAYRKGEDWTISRTLPLMLDELAAHIPVVAIGAGANQRMLLDFAKVRKHVHVGAVALSQEHLWIRRTVRSFSRYCAERDLRSKDDTPDSLQKYSDVPHVFVTWDDALGWIVSKLEKAGVTPYPVRPHN